VITYAPFTDHGKIIGFAAYALPNQRFIDCNGLGYAFYTDDTGVIRYSRAGGIGKRSPALE
jgi:hypothetical protein